MARNYQREKEWEENKYKRMVAKIDKNLASEFLNKLDKPYATWLREQIENYLQKNNAGITPRNSSFCLYIYYN